MSAVHDVLKSSNPDVQALVRVISGLAAQLAALQAEVAAFPQAFVVPDEKGRIVIANRIIPSGTPVAEVQADIAPETVAG